MAEEIGLVVAAAVAEVEGDRNRLMDVVQAVQQRVGHVPEVAIRLVAEALGIHRVEVEDMVSFYAYLDREPKGRFRIRLARTPVSLMNGAAAVADAFQIATGARLGGTSSDGAFTLEWTADLGMADQEPSAMINGTVVTALTPADAPTIVAALRESQLSGTRPVLPDQQAISLPRAKVASNLVQSGPVIFRQSARGAGLRAALTASAEEVVHAVTKAGLRGRGGAGFPTGLKWKLCRKSIGDEHYIICNADEGEPGTFKDRVLLTEIADAVFEGMTIGGYALGARHGLVYLRGEYVYLFRSLQDVLQRRHELGLLGTNICGHEGFDFDIRIQLGAGAYVCGEESALIESLEGKRGAPRDRPPFPTERGYRHQPTAVDNVETFACVTRIMEKGPDWFRSFGTQESSGTKLLSVSGDCPHPGVYEVPFGITVNNLLDLIGAPEAAFVQVGGPSGQCVAPKDYGRRIAFEDLSTGGSIVVFSEQRDVLEVARLFTEFFADESCGWCVPCRVGTTLMKNSLEKILGNRGTLGDVKQLEALAGVVTRMSRCGLGQTAANPILTTMRNFPQAWEARLQPETFLPHVTLREALAEATAVQGREPIPGEEGA